MSDRWHILGVGSIGGLFAHRLSAGGADVRLLTRDATETHRKLTLDAEQGPVVRVFDCDSVDNTSAIEQVLITTKSWAARDALMRIQHRLTDYTVVVAMMNGMQHVDDLRDLVPETQLFLASTTAGCHCSGDVWVPAGTGKTIIGTDTDHSAPPWLGCWQRGVSNLSWQTDMTARLVEKVAINCCINPLTAIHRVSNGELLTKTHLKQSNTVIGEVSLVLEDLGYQTLSIELRQRVHDVMTDTAQNRSSMLNDLVAGRRTEADAIIGWLLRQTKRELPALNALATQLRALEPNQ